MQNTVKRMMARFLADRKKRRQLLCIVTVLSVLVASGVYHELMQPVVTMTSKLVCGQTEHSHTSGCYEALLTCGQEASDEHAHSDACYKNVLACKMAEHAHADDCYEKEPEDPNPVVATVAPAAVPVVLSVEETEAPAAAEAPSAEASAATEAPAATDAPVVPETAGQPAGAVSENTEAPAGTEAPVEVVAPETTEEAAGLPEVTPEATAEATAEPSAEPAVEATAEPTAEPTAEATAEPTAEPLTLEGLSASAGTVSVGQSVSWSFSSTGAAEITYTLTDESGAQVDSGSLSADTRSISWLADRAGSFTMTVTVGNGAETKSASSTVTVEAVEELTVSAACSVSSAFAGDSVRFSIVCAGGAEPLTCAIEVRQNGELLAQYNELHNSVTVETRAASSVTDLTLEVMVIDANGAVASDSRTIPVAVHDRESASDWTRSAYVELTGNWIEDLIAVARTQLGYTESDVDFVVNAEGKRQGYTRYGDWYGMDYEEWCAMFVSFCLEHADIPASYVPHEAGCQKWIGELNYLGLYEPAYGDYEPQAGDIIFFDWNGSGDSDHVGIITSADDSEIHTIEGNSGTAVREKTYAADDETIMGFGTLSRAYEKFLADEAQDEAVEAMLPEDLTGLTAAVSAESVNLRAAAIDGEVLAVLNQGDEVVIQAVEGDWYQVTAAELTGWVRGDLLEIVIETEPATESEAALPAENLIPDTVYGALKADVEEAYAAGDAETLTALEARVEEALANAEITADERNELIALIYGETVGVTEIELMEGVYGSERYSLNFVCCEECSDSVVAALSNAGVAYPAADFGVNESIAAQYIPSAAHVNAYYSCSAVIDSHTCGAGKANGKVLDYWYVLDNSGNQVELKAGTALPETCLPAEGAIVNAYAAWKEAPATLAVTFNNPDGSEILTNAEVACYTAFGEVKPADPAMDGCTFLGWSADGGETFAADGDILSTDAIYTAIFDAAITVVTPDLGSGETTSVYSVRIGRSLADAVDAEGNGISAAILENGHIFTGWLPEGETAPVADLSACILTGAMTITAQYEAARTVTFQEMDFEDADADGDTGEYVPTFAFYAVNGSAMSAAIDAQGATIAGLPTGASAPTHEFLGWQTVAEDGTALDFALDTVISADVTVQAKYHEQKSVSVTFTYEGENYVYILPNNTTTFGEALSAAMIAPLSETVNVLPINEIMADREIVNENGKPMLHSFSGWAYNADLDGDLEANELVEAKEELVLSTSMTFFPTYVSGYTITLHDIAPDGTEIVRENVEAIDLQVPFGEAAMAYFEETLMDEDTAAADCIWYTRDAHGNREKLETAVLEEPLADGEELHLYTYSYQIVLTLEDESAEEAQSLLDALIPAANAEVSVNGTTLTITVREGRLSYGDFVVDGVDYTLYGWTFSDSSITSIDDLIEKVNNGTWTEGKQILVTVTTPSFDTRTQSITFYAHVNGNWTVIETRQMTLYKVSGDNYYLSAAQLESVYGDLGFEMNELQYNSSGYTVFPYQTGTTTNTARRANFQNTGNGFSLAYNSSNATSVYYMPGTSITDDGDINYADSIYVSDTSGNCFYTITVEDPNSIVYESGDEMLKTQYVPYGETKVVKLKTPESIYAWTCTGTNSTVIEGKSADGYTEFAVLGNQAYTITLTKLPTYIVTAEDINGISTVLAEVLQTENSTVTVTLSNVEGFEWICTGTGIFKEVDEANGTTTFTFTPLSQNYTITQALKSGYYLVTYDVNIKTSEDDDREYPAIYDPDYMPTVEGHVTYKVAVKEGEEHTILSPNYLQYNTEDPSTEHYGSYLMFTHEFSGWKDGNVTRQPGNTLTISGEKTFTGVWTTITGNRVDFFVFFDSSKTSLPSNSNDRARYYTRSVYATKVTQGSVGSLTTIIGAEEFGTEKSVQANIDIRTKLYGDGYVYTTSSWWGGTSTQTFQIAEFPDDDYVLKQLRDLQTGYLETYAGTSYAANDNPQGYVDAGNALIVYNGQAVPVDMLTSRYFELEWYVFKTTDTYHIDGRLKAKPAKLTIEKTFYGDSKMIQSIKDSGNYTITVSGTFSDGSTSKTFNLPENTSGNDFSWTLDESYGLIRGNTYTVKESGYTNNDVPAYLTTAEYIVRNSETFSPANRWLEYTGDGVAVEATSYDDNVTTYQTVHLTNSYVPLHTMVVHKINERTGASLSGVEFELRNAAGEVVPLYLRDDGVYQMSYNEGDPVTSVKTDSNGRIMIGWAEPTTNTNIGTFTLVEKSVPSGYNAIDPIEFTIVDTQRKLEDDTVEGTITITESSDDASVSGIVLTVNNTPQVFHVKVVKDWGETADKKDVDLELYRVAAGTKTEVLIGKTTLNGSEYPAWEYEWDNLPLYDGNEPAQYIVKETRIGTTNYSDTADTDGYLTYNVTGTDAMTYTDANDNIIRLAEVAAGTTPYRALLTVHNSIDTGAFSFPKYGENGSVPLSGATFKLYSISVSDGEVDESKLTAAVEAGQVVLKYDGSTTAVTEVDSATSGNDGTVDFGTVARGTYYMVETSAPEHYEANTKVYKVEIGKTSDTITELSSGTVVTSISNMRSHVTVTLYKKSGETLLKGATFALYEDAGCTTQYGTETYTSDGDGAIVIENLPVGTYYLKETVAPSGYKLSEEIYTLTVSSTGAATLVNADGTALTDIQNEPNQTTVTIKKTDWEWNTTNLLTGAAFQVKASGSSEALNPTETDDDGVWVFEDLADGTYVISETKAPDGYYVMPGDITFTIADGVITFDGGDVINNEDYADVDGTTILVRNHAGVELPHTGGSGTTPYTIGGLMLMLSALLYGCNQRRKRERRVEG